MMSRLLTRTGDLTGASLRRRFAKLIVAGFILGFSHAGNAAPVAPLPGYLADVGDSYFAHGDQVVSVELVDPLQVNSTFGFYFQGTPGTLIPIFDGNDLGGGQAAVIDFGLVPPSPSGFVADADTPANAPTLFPSSALDIGLYFSVAGTTLFSDPTLNIGGLDVFTAQKLIVNPTIWALFFEIPIQGTLTPVHISILSGVSPIPLPPTVYLMGSLLPILMFMSRRRKRAAAAAA